MNPLVLAGGALALGWIAKGQLDKMKASHHPNPVLDTAAKELIQGRGYTVQLSIDSSKISPPRDTATMAQVIKSTFQQLGWNVMGNPAPKTALDTQNFIAGQPSQWVMQGTWTKTEKSMSSGPPWLGMAIAYQMPAA